MYANDADAPLRAPITVPALRQMKQRGERIAALTAYDASFARAMDHAGIDAVLVGDSLGMVVQGGANTVSVTLDDMVYHSRCVAKGLRSALLIADMPFQTYASPERALDAATALLAEGLASIVKLEGAGFVSQGEFSGSTAEGGSFIGTTDKWGVLVVVSQDGDSGFVANYTVTSAEATN